MDCLELVEDPTGVAKKIAQGIFWNLPQLNGPDPPWNGIDGLTPPERTRAQGAPLIAIAVPPLEWKNIPGQDPFLDPCECYELASKWIPTHPDRRYTADFAEHHRLVAIICFKPAHYVVFCRRINHPSRCRFYNDIPNLTKDMPDEMGWEEVPLQCLLHGLQPSFVLYESWEHMCCFERDVEQAKAANEPCVQM